MFPEAINPWLLYKIRKYPHMYKYYNQEFKHDFSHMPLHAKLGPHQVGTYQNLCSSFASLTNNDAVLKVFDIFIFSLTAFIQLHNMRKYLMPYVNNKGADQPAHSRSLISTFVVRC